MGTVSEAVSWLSFGEGVAGEREYTLCSRLHSGNNSTAEDRNDFKTIEN